MAPKADRSKLPCCGGSTCLSGCFLRGNSRVQHKDGCRCAPGRGGARARSGPIAEEAPIVALLGTDTESFSESADEEEEEIDEDRVGDWGSQEEEEEEEIVGVGGERWEIPARRSSTHTRGPLDFAKPMYSADACRVQGQAQRKLLGLAQKLEVAEDKLELFLSYCWFLLHDLLRMQGRWAVAPHIRASWLDGGLGALTAQEAEYFRHSVPSMEAMQRSRAPWSVSLYYRLHQELSNPLADGVQMRLLQVWIHLVSITYFIGDHRFVDTVILNPPEWEKCSVKDVLAQYINGVEQRYADALGDRLRLYGLTRQSARRWINFNDGTRLSSPGCERVAVFSRGGLSLELSYPRRREPKQTSQISHKKINGILVADWGLYDSLLHVNASWATCSSSFARKFLELQRAAEQTAGRLVRKATRRLMQTILTFPLLGRPVYVRKVGSKFLDCIHCYWAKFLFSCSTALLRSISSASEDALRETDCKYSFIGPAPRFLYATFRGDRDSRQHRRKCLDDLRLVRDFVAEQFCVEHAVYNIQISPCEFQHFIKGRLQFPTEGLPSPGARGGRLSPAKAMLLNLSATEEHLLRQRFELLWQQPWCKDNWEATWCGVGLTKAR